MKTRILVLLLALVGVPAFAQNLADPKTITASASTCTAANCVRIRMDSIPSVGISVVNAGTYTLEIEQSRDRDGTTFTALNAIDDTDTSTLVQEITAPGEYTVVNSGIRWLQIRASAYTSGTPVVNLVRGVLAPMQESSASAAAGTEYTEGAVDATITGVAFMFEDSGNTLRAAPGTLAGGLLVDLGANNDVTVTGTVTVTDGAGALNVIVDSAATLTVTATDLDVQSGGADILSTTAFNAAFGTAGTADTQVLSVQGIASMTPVTVNGGASYGTPGTTPVNVQPCDSDSCQSIVGGSAAISGNVGQSGLWSFSGTGTAGTAAAGVVTVQGIASMTPVQVQSNSANLATQTTLATLALESGGNLATIAGDTTDIETAVELIDNAAGTTPADNFANPTGALTTFALLGCWDGATWDRCAFGADWTVGTAIGTTGPGNVAVYSDFDGSALPTATNVDTEGEAVPIAASIKGVQYMMLVSEDGSLQYGTSTTPLVVGDGAGALNVIIDSSATLTVNAHAVTNAGTFAVQVDGSALTALQLIDNASFADEAAFTYASSGVTASGFVAESTTDTLADGTIGAAVMTLSRFLRTTPSGYSAGGGTPVNMLSDASDNEDETAICTGPCTVYDIIAFNHTAASAFLRCENDTAANTTPGSETNADGEFDYEIPGNTTGAGFVKSFPVGVSFSTALTCWIVSDEASSGTTDVAANDVRVQFVRVQ